MLLIESNQNHATIKDTEVSTAIPAAMGMGGGYIPMIMNTGGSETLMANEMEENQKTIVRRLTPLECTRLQGFPDNWIEIGEWTDSQGKKHKDADSPKYKALGNSIALPFWEWLARRIAAEYERPITMGSLFDGIGGFPLAFERAGGEALWASEIEEFCIAVTKQRFGDE